MTEAINEAITEALFNKVNSYLYSSNYIMPIADKNYFVNYSIISNPKFHTEYFSLPFDGTFLLENE
jgi:hypothetical protein